MSDRIIEVNRYHNDPEFKKLVKKIAYIQAQMFASSEDIRMAINVCETIRKMK